MEDNYVLMGWYSNTNYNANVYLYKSILVNVLLYNVLQSLS